MTIAVIGTGYVGLVTGTCLAEMGNKVVCVDIDETKIKKMQKGVLPIYEPGLGELLTRNIKEDRLTFSVDLEKSIQNVDAIFLALPTPSSEDGSADLTHVLAVADKLGSILKGYCVIVNKSTVPVGTTRLVKERIAKSSKIYFDVVSNPEFLREGFAVEDFMNPDRIIVGTSSKKAQKIMSEIYKPFVGRGSLIYFMDESSSEMTKYAANAFLATKISFMNEIANLCETVGADVDLIRLGVGADDRIGKRFLYPGIGYGGSCFPKDVLALINISESNGYDFKILNAVNGVNKLQKTKLTKMVINFYKNDLSGKTFALWGLAFKPDTDDIREAPALGIISDLTSAGANVIAYDPEAMSNVRLRFKGNNNLSFADDSYSALHDADALIIATEWSEFRSPDFSLVKQELKQHVIFDGRNLYNLQEMKKNGFYYESIGRETVHGK